MLPAFVCIKHDQFVEVSNVFNKKHGSEDPSNLLILKAGFVKYL